MPLRPVAIAAATLLVAGVVLGLVLPLVALASGCHLVRVTGASMAPSINRGAMLAVRPLPDRASASGSVHAGDVVSFRPASSSAVPELAQQVVTHRVVAVGTAGLVTAGDANTAADPLLVRPSSVIGVASTRWLPLSAAMGAATSPAGVVATYLPALGAFALMRRSRAGAVSRRPLMKWPLKQTSVPSLQVNR